MTNSTHDYWVRIEYNNGDISIFENKTLNEAWEIKSTYEETMRHVVHNPFGKNKIVKTVDAGRTT